MQVSLALSILLVCADTSPTPPFLRSRDDITAVVNFSVARREPQHLESGFIYGISDVPDQILIHWYQDMGLNYGRAGGAQLESPSRG